MKKLSFILMALAMVMGMTQCKKDDPTGNTDSTYDGPTTHITLTLNNGNNSKSDVDPNDDDEIAPVTFKSDDQIVVAYEGRCVGTLTYTEAEGGGGVFSGNINATPASASSTDKKKLYFYFLGNKNKSTDDAVYKINTNTQTSKQTIVVNISDQTAELPTISYAPSVEDFVEGRTSFTVKYGWLKNQCALVKFEMENIYHNAINSVDNNDDAIYTTTKLITIKGMPTQVSIDLSNPSDNPWGYLDNNTVNTIDNSFTWSGSGDIKLYMPDNNKADSVRYAVVAPKTYSGEGDLDVAFDYANDKYGFTGTYEIGKAIANNDYYKDAKLRLVWHSGAFSVSSTEQVVFSRGNLQYNAYRNKWRFATHQYDYVGGKTNNVHEGNVVKDEISIPANTTEMSDNEQISADYNGWIDLFGWGTGNNPTKHGNISLSENYASTYTWTEWGTNYISNSGVSSANTSHWVTMTRDEWKGLFNYLDENGHIGYATVNGIHGVVLLPDAFNTATLTSWTPMHHISGGTMTHVINFTENTFDLSAWNTMEQNGAVFLPAAGDRDPGNNNTDFDSGVGETGRQDCGTYWSSQASTYQPTTQAYHFMWGDDINGPTGTVGGKNYHLECEGDRMRYYGNSVRLVHRL